MIWTRSRLLLTFCVLLCAISWPPIFWMLSQGLTWHNPLGRALSVWHMFAPLLATLTLHGAIRKQPVMEPLGVRLSVNRWWLVAWLLPVVVLAIGLAFIAATGGDVVVTQEALIANKASLVPADQIKDFETYLRDNPIPPPWKLVLMGLPAGLTFNLFGAFGIELAFRGLLFREVPGGYVARSLFIGLLWAAWMVPSVMCGNMYPDSGLSALPLLVCWCVVASAVLIYIRVRGGSILASAITLATIFALTKAAADLSFGTPDWMRPFYGASGIAGLLVCLAGFYVHDRFFATQSLMRSATKG